MENSPLVSVVITFYNQAHLVPRALRSVVTQTYRNLDIIVVDDGSEDDAEGAVKQFTDSRIRFYRKKNGGVATARNLGIREARGGYIAFLDGDDVYLPKKIEVLMKKLLELDEKVIASGCYFVTQRGIIIQRRICGKFKTSPGDPITEFPKVIPSLLIYDRQVLEDLEGFPEDFRIGQDGIFNRMVFKKYSVISLPQPLVLKERDDKTNNSRRIFLSYEKTFDSFNQKLERMKQELSEEDYALYHDRVKIMFLRGLLAMGNMQAARRWFREVCEFRVSCAGGQLVRIAVITRVNIYRLTLRLRDAANFVRYLPATLIYRKQWRQA